MIYDTIDGMTAISVPDGIHAININGRNEAGDGDDGIYVDTDNGSDDTFESADGRTWYRADSKAETALQPADNYISRAGNYLGVGQPADLDGFGKGGILLGGGHPDRGQGTYLSLDGMPNWVCLVPGRTYQPQELIIYGSSGQGYAETVVGTNQIAWKYGSEFDNFWGGKTIYFLRKQFKVLSVISQTLLSVTELDGSPVIFPSVEIEAFNFSYTIGQGTVDIVGDRMHWKTGTPLPPLFFQDFRMYLGVGETLTTVAEYISPKEWRLATPPGNAQNVPYYWIGNIFDQLTTFRVQAIAGSNEENVNLYSIAGQNFYERHYALRAGLAGPYGKCRPIYIGTGAYGAYLPRDQIGVYPEGGPGGSYGSGFVSLGGVQGLEAVRVYTPTTMALNRNRIDVPATPSGFRSSMRAVGVDSSVGFNIDVKGGGGDFAVTQDFARTLFIARGAATSVNFVTTTASTTGNRPVITAEGSDTNIALGFAAKGTGGISLGNHQQNYPTAYGDTNANARVTIQAEGLATNLDFRILTKGTGLLQFGTWTTNADAAVNGYITVKDSAGNTRKLATIA
jgi:hypothetical protein